MNYCFETSLPCVCSKLAAFEVLEQWNEDSYTQNLLCLNSCTAIAGLLEHSTASMRTTITKVLVLITGGAIINYVRKSINQSISLFMSLYHCCTFRICKNETWRNLIQITGHPLRSFFLGCLTICLQKWVVSMDKERHCESLPQL